MNLIKINLLPYRELQLQQQKKSFELVQSPRRTAAMKA